MAEPTTLDDLLGQAQPSQPSGLQRLFSILGPALIGAQNPQAGLAAIKQLQEMQQTRQAQAMGQQVGQIGQRIAQVAQSDPARAADLADRAALHFSTTKGFEGGAKQFTSLSERLREQAQSASAASLLGDGLLKRMLDSKIPVPRAIEIANSQQRNFKYEVRGNQILKFDMVNPGARPQIVETLPTEDTVQSFGGGMVGVTPGQPGTLPMPGQPDAAQMVPGQPGVTQAAPQSPVQPPAGVPGGLEEVGRAGRTSIFRLPGGAGGTKFTASQIIAAREIGIDVAGRTPEDLTPFEASSLQQRMADNAVDEATRTLIAKDTALMKSLPYAANPLTDKSVTPIDRSTERSLQDTPPANFKPGQVAYLNDKQIGQLTDLNAQLQMVAGARLAVQNILRDNPGENIGNAIKLAVQKGVLGGTQATAIFDAIFGPGRLQLARAFQGAASQLSNLDVNSVAEGLPKITDLGPVAATKLDVIEVLFENQKRALLGRPLRKFEDLPGFQAIIRDAQRAQGIVIERNVGGAK